MDMTSPKWSVSTATRWDTLQGNAKDLGTKIAETGIKTALEGYEEVPTNIALMAFLDSDVHNEKTSTYKRGLAFVEEKLVFYKKNEVIFCEQLDVLKRDISYKDSKISMLKSKLEKLKQEKESKQLKIENFDNAFKNLDKLIWSQIPDKSRKGVGFVSYNVVPPPLTGLFSPSNLDLSYSGLEEFQQPKFEGYGPKSSKIFSEDISNEVRESPDALLVWEFFRPNSSVVNAVRANQGHPQKKDQGYVDSGCSRHMTGNMSYLSDFKEFDGGYVTFGGGAKGGKITGKGTLKTGKLDFEDVYFVKELHYAGVCQVLLKVPRKNNMYSVDIKNIVPKESLTCLVAKATLDESMLWHRRLGHVNFKTINKLVKENLVRGLPTKHFENDQTCVACLKGKQHKASCKSKIQNSITQPLFMLHMDLFGPTFVSSLMNKKYCLVVTDDYSRFTWVFFLATKDETSGILKRFITEIENLVDKKVNIIRCDMNQSSKNRVLVVKPHNKAPYELFRGRTPAISFMRPFGCHVTILNTLDYLGKFAGKSNERFFVRYSLNSKAFRKGIKREFSVARTPQQNGVAERRNRTLIEAARTMLADSKLPTTFWAKAVNTACYVQNRVLVVKPHNKTPYELFRGRTPALSFMRPFGCHVTILNTLDYLGKFDGKSDEGFFVGYSLNSKAFRINNIRTRKVEENLHIRFLEDKPIIVGDGPKWLFDIDVLTKSMNYVPVVAGTNSNDLVGTEESISEGHSSKETGSSQDGLLMPLWKDGLLFDSSSKNAIPTGKDNSIVSTGSTKVILAGVFVMNSDHNLWNIVLNGNRGKRTGRDPKGNIMILPPVSVEEQIAVQRETKARTILLQSLPEDHMAYFHHLDDARDIRLAVKARFGGNDESKKMRKSMLKQEFSEFRVSESEGLHKGYDRFQKILSQLNQMQAKPDNEDCNMKFLRALPPSWSLVAITLKTKGGLDYLSFNDLYNKLRTLEIDVKGDSSYDSRGTSAPTHSAFVSVASTNSKMTYPDQSHSTTFTTASSIPAASSNVIESVLHSFVAESDPQQQITYEDFDQIGKMDLEELDIKWQMAMLSIKINRFEKKAGRKMKFNNKDAARFVKGKVKCYKCSELGHFARECTGKQVDSKARYSSFKLQELNKGEETKALLSVDSMVNWSDHEGEDVEIGAAQVYGMIAGS
ncbi:putative ribonuclease H-like domain-containing protein [Tanacetum coccineum]